MLKYKVEGYAETRDAITWIALTAPNFKFGLSLDDVFAGLDHGYQSVRRQLYDAERVAQWESSHRLMQEAYAFFKNRDDHLGTRALQAAGEQFTMLRRIKGAKVSRQELGDTEHGANTLDE